MFNLIRLMTQSSIVRYLAIALFVAVSGFVVYQHIKISDLRVTQANLESDNKTLQQNIEITKQANLTLTDELNNSNERMLEFHARWKAVEEEVHQLNIRSIEHRKERKELLSELETLKNENIEIKMYLDQRVPDDVIDGLCQRGHCGT